MVVIPSNVVRYGEFVVTELETGPWKHAMVTFDMLITPLLLSRQQRGRHNLAYCIPLLQA
jgi:hypothetical protein